MNVSLFGLGYVGCVTAGCLARGGHTVSGVDINAEKVREINDGVSPVEEPGLPELIAEAVADGRLRATTEPTEAVADSDLSFLCVGTPLDDTGRLNTTSLYNTLGAIAEGVRGKDEHTVVVRSTVPPKTTRSLREYLREKVDEWTTLNVVVNPEFLREGTAIDDFYHPPYVVIGAFEEREARRVLDLYESFDIQADVEVVEPELAESLKMVNNVFHALKICFANEVGTVATDAGVDGAALMELVCRDRKLNISPKYLEPGFAFGGSCLPKDTQAMATMGEALDVPTPLLSSITESNDNHLRRLARRIDDAPGDVVGIAGISFKSETTDMRNSPGLRLAKLLETDVLLYAGDVSLSELVGANRDYLDKTFPDIESSVVEAPTEFVERVDTVVFANQNEYPEFLPELESKVVFDPSGAMATYADRVAVYDSVVRHAPGDGEERRATLQSVVETQ